MKRFFFIIPSIFIFWINTNAQNPFLPKYDAVKRSERCFTITWESKNQFGSVWFVNKVDFSRDTLFNFVVYMGDRDGNGADGIAFVMHQDPRDTITDPSQQVIIGGAGTWDLEAAAGDDGGGLGYAKHDSRVGPNTIPGPHGPGDSPENHKIQPSVAIEFDTWNNTDVQDGKDGKDGNGINQTKSKYYGWDHTSVVYNGDIYGQQQVITDALGEKGRILPLKPAYAFGAANNPDGSAFHNIEDNRSYLYQVRWIINPDGTQTLQLWADVYNGSTNTDDLQMIMTHTDNTLNNIFGGNSLMRIGFTGSTGGSINEQTICLLGENLKPITEDDFAVLNKNRSTVIDIESNDNDPDGDQLHVPVIINMPKNGSVVIFDSLDVNYMRYTSNTNYIGMDTIRYVTCDVNSTKPYAKCDTASVFIKVVESLNIANYNKSLFNNTEIIGEDTVCLSAESNYQIEINTNKNHYLDMSDVTSGNTTDSPIILNYQGSDVGAEFTYDFYVKPNRAINMVAESNACAGAVTVPLAYSNQNWAIHPTHGGTELGSGVTVGTNGIMVAEHSGNLLVSRLSYTTPISDWSHIAVVYSKNGVELFLNGSLVRSRLAYCSSDDKYPPAAIGTALYSPKFQGNIDEFRLWDKALSAKEISFLKDKKIVNEIEGLLYYASFDNGEFIKALGNIGLDSMLIDGITTDIIKESSWDLAPYMGSRIDDLRPFDPASLQYFWSNGTTDKMTSLQPVKGDQQLSVQAYNDFLTISDTLNVVGEDCGLQATNTRYLRFRSYYSEDNSQVNIYEIQAYKDGSNVALNKSTYANSHEFGNNEPNAVDGNDGSRWSSNRNDPGPDSDNPHFIVVDLLQGYDLDSIILNIEGFDHWEQTFDFAISSDSVNWEIIGSEVSSTGIFKYLTNEITPDGLTLKFNEETTGANQQILFPITVTDFQNILTSQYTINWDPTVVEYQGVQDFALRDLDAGSFYLVEPGRLREIAFKNSVLNLGNYHPRQRLVF